MLRTDVLVYRNLLSLEYKLFNSLFPDCVISLPASLLLIPIEANITIYMQQD
ncbi:hypothetical protein BVRB_1g014130 [Beta vulgaris subsp. vulgaris]|nr:hypothetical protein BVRB_1g014130 [Beta vulgaris subsp. vulgaris]